MKQTKKLKNKYLIIKGLLLVTIPVILIILGLVLGLPNFITLNSKLNILIAAIAGWIYWEATYPIWIRWALKNNVEESRILKIGQLSLILWNKSQIEKVKKSMVK